MLDLTHPAFHPLSTHFYLFYAPEGWRGQCLNGFSHVLDCGWVRAMRNMGRKSEGNRRVNWGIYSPGAFSPMIWIFMAIAPLASFSHYLLSAFWWRIPILAPSSLGVVIRCHGANPWSSILSVTSFSKCYW